MLIKFESVGLIERILAPIGMLFGVLLIYSGVFNLMRTDAFFFNGISTVTFPFFSAGIFMCMIGFIMASLGLSSISWQNNATTKITRNQNIHIR